MRRIVPDVRWRLLQQALKSKQTPKDDRYLAEVYTAITTDRVDRPLEVAIDAIETPYHRDRVAAFLLSGANLEHIARCLRMDIQAVQHIEKLFLDRSVFWHKLDYFQYAEKYEKTVCQKKNAQYIIAAIQGGPEVLEGFFLHGYDILEVNPSKFASTIISHASYNIQRGRGYQLTADVTKESLKWVKAGSNALTSLGESMKQRSATDLLIEIKKVQGNQGIDDLGLAAPADLLH